MNQTHRKHFRLVEEFTHGTLLIQSAYAPQGQTPADGDWDSPQETLRTLLSELNDVHQELASIDKQASLRIVEGLRADLQGACIERDQLRADLTAAKLNMATGQRHQDRARPRRGVGRELNHRGERIEELQKALVAQGKELTAAKDAHALAVTAYNRLDAAYSALMNGK